MRAAGAPRNRLVFSLGKEERLVACLSPSIHLVFVMPAAAIPCDGTGEERKKSYGKTKERGGGRILDVVLLVIPKFSAGV